MNETVKLSIETYEEMKAEIKSLHQQVKEKTVIKEVSPPIYLYIGLVIFWLMFMLVGMYLAMGS